MKTNRERAVEALDHGTRARAMGLGDPNVGIGWAILDLADAVREGALVDAEVYCGYTGVEGDLCNQRDGHAGPHTFDPPFKREPTDAENDAAAAGAVEPVANPDDDCGGGAA